LVRTSSTVGAEWHLPTPPTGSSRERASRCVGHGFSQPHHQPETFVGLLASVKPFNKTRWDKYAMVVPTEIGSRKTIGDFRTLREAASAEREAILARDQGTDIAIGTVTVADLLKRHIANRTLGRRTVEE
jgi:hypothetical protein